MKLLVVTVLACVVCSAFAKHDPAFKEFREIFGKKLLKKNADFLKRTHIPQAEAGKLIYKVIKKYMLDRGAKAADAEKVAETKSKAASTNFDKVDSEKLALALGGTMATGLEEIGKLNHNNAENLADEAAQDFDTVISNMDSFRNPEIAEALYKGYEKFLARFGTSYNELFDTMNKQLIDEFRAA